MVQLFFSERQLAIGSTSSICFSEYFSYVHKQGCFISDLMIMDGDSRAWNLQLRREPNEWKLESLGCLLHQLEHAEHTRGEDSIKWTLSNNGLFTANSLHQWLVPRVHE